VVGEVEGSEVGEGTRTGDTTPRKLEKSREVRYGNLWKMRVRDTDGFKIVREHTKQPLVERNRLETKDRVCFI
jgi:hypothetical protein